MSEKGKPPSSGLILVGATAIVSVMGDDGEWHVLWGDPNAPAPQGVVEVRSEVRSRDSSMREAIALAQKAVVEFSQRYEPGAVKRIPLVSSGKGVRRNGPCPCGSGKKFKRCYGRG